MEPQDVLRRLEIKLVKAREWRDRARRDFDVNITCGTGIPHTCSRVAIRDSSYEYRRAIHAAEKALREHTDFVLHGTIPEDLNSEVDV